MLTHENFSQATRTATAALPTSVAPVLPVAHQRRAYTVKDFCAVYGVGATKAHELLASGDLERVKLGTRTLIPVESAERWFAGLPRITKGGAKNE